MSAEQPPAADPGSTEAPGAPPADTTASERRPEPAADPARSALARARAAARAAGQDRRPAAGRRGDRRSGGWSGARPDDRDPQRLGDEVARLLDARGWTRQVRVTSVEARWPELVGAELAEHCRPERFLDGELHVVASSTAWATQVRLLAPKLAAAVNAAVGETVVRSVVVRGPSGPSWRRGRLRVSDGRGPRDTYG